MDKNQSQLPPKLPPIIIILIPLILFFGIASLLLFTQNKKLENQLTQKENASLYPSPSVTSSLVPTPIDTTPPTFIKDLIINFYTALSNQEGEKLFNLMTPPQGPDEMENYTWLVDKSPDGNFYRAFFRIKILNPQIQATQQTNDTTYQITVADQIQAYSNAGIAEWSPLQTRIVYITAINTNDKWLVDKYTAANPRVGNATTPKYSGFGQ